MNDVQCLIDRQLGLCGHLNYDSVLRRLVVSGEECYYGLQSGPVDAGFDTDPPIFACRFADAPGYEHILALANEDGRVALQDTSKVGGSLEGIQCHNNAVFDLVWQPEQVNFVTVSGDHTAALWSVTGAGTVRAGVLGGHARSVKSAAWRERGVLATGARDGHVRVWDPRTHAAELTLSHAHAAPAPRTPGSHGKRRPRVVRAASVTALAFCGEALLSAGEGDGCIKVWDLRKNYSSYKRSPLPLHVLPYAGCSARSGYTSLAVAGPRLYASCMDGVIYCYNVATYEPRPVMRYSGHESGTFYIRAVISDDSEYLVSGSSDAFAYVWSVRRQRPLLRLAGHRAEVTCAAFPKRAAYQAPVLVTCGDDARHKLWRIGPEELPADGDYRGRAEMLPREKLEQRDMSPPPQSYRVRRDSVSTVTQKQRASKSKRCLTQLLSAASDAGELPSKRARGDVTSPTSASSDVTTPSKRPASAGNDDTTPPKKPRSTNTDGASSEWGYIPQPGPSFMTPTKNYEKRGCRLLSPKSPKPSSPVKTVIHVSPSKVRVVSFSTPTKDLPDFIRDGSAPHLRLMSPIKRKRDCDDWLTQLRRKIVAPSPAPAPQPGSPAPAPAPSSVSPAPPRRSSTTDKTPKAKQTRTLLKYFTVKQGK